MIGVIARRKLTLHARITLARHNHPKALNPVAVVGAGMQGTAAAYDLADSGLVGRLTLADCDPRKAKAACERVNDLVKTPICVAAEVDACDPKELERLLSECTLAVSALPYPMHGRVEVSAVEAGCHAVDMGQDTDDLMELTHLDAAAEGKGVCVVPDCGLAPGLVNSMAMALLPGDGRAESVRLYCGGLPLNPKPPFNYSLRFSLDSLIGEYQDVAIALKSGDILRLQPLSEVESVHFEGFGELEAFVTSGGSSTGPHELLESVTSYEYKTLRYKGHCDLMRMFRDFGYWSEEPLPAERALNAKDVFCAVLEKRLASVDEDVVLARAEVVVGGVRRIAEAVEYADPVTGFSAMERLTGFPTSVVALEVLAGRVSPGLKVSWQAVSPATILRELERRQISVRIDLEGVAAP